MGLRLLFSTRPALQLAMQQQQTHLQLIEPIRVQSRDGLTLLCYICLPQLADGETAPLVVVPHGGPSDRDSWGFDSTTHWLVSRGMGVLNVNFRGSTGLGHTFY